MSGANGRLAQLFLRLGSPLAGLRRVPLVGPCVRWASAKLVPRDTLVWMQVRQGPAQGLWLHLNPRTGRSYLEGGGEPEVQAALREHLKPGMSFFDIGANIGFFSLLAARLVGKAGKVVAFEADPEVAARLREHAARNAMNWITMEQKAVWSEPRTVFFARIDPASSPDRGLGHVVSGGASNTIQVDAVALDDYILTEPSPDFLKCDVEGAEVEVFRGAQRLLKEKRPGILCEMHSEENRRTLLDEFSRYGYDCKPCGEYHVLALPR
ncbi:MAG: FkbM family methyltransferase [Candidatus Acidiferrum sp.]